MLKIIRKRLKIILWTLVVSFVLWEVGAILANRQSPSVYAGTLYGRPVPIQEFQSAVDQCRQFALLTYGERAARAIPPEMLIDQAWDLLLLSKAARRAGIRIADQDVVKELSRWPLFQRNGRFDVGMYQHVVQYGLGTTPRIFEEGIRRRLAMQQLLDRAVGTPAVSDAELETAWRAQEDTARFAYALIDPAAFAAAATPSEAAVRAHHQQHAGDFQSDPKVRIRYLAITPASFEADIPISEADILEEYLRQVLPEMRGSWPTSDRRMAIRRQLAGAKAKELARELAETLREQGARTPDLAALGTPHGLTPRETSAVAIIDPIPGIASSRTVAQAAFQLPTGELSAVIETPEAYYLFTVLEKLAAQPLAYADAAPRIHQHLQDQTAQRWARERAENLFATVQELTLARTGDPLGAAVKGANPPAKSPLPQAVVSKTDFVKRSSELGALGTAGALLGDEAFSLADGRAQPPRHTPHGWVLVQMLARQPVDPEAFAKAKDGLRTQLVERKRSDAVTQWLTTLRAEGQPRPNPSLAAPPRH